jgi:hypothetical protein
MLKLMNNIKLLSLLISTLTCAATVNAELYKGLDDEGNIVYSDKPFDNAHQFTPPPLSVVDAHKVKPKEDPVEIEKNVAFKYTDFDITSPKNNETIWNEPDMAVKLSLKPKLNTAEKHTVWLLLNGKPVVKNSQSMTLQAGRISRGAHQLQAQVRNKEGKIIVRTRTILIHTKNAATSGRAR